MGVDLQTYRSRIGSFNNRHCLGCGLPSSVTADVADVVSSGILGALFAQCIELLLVLLLLAGDVELNPGPHSCNWKEKGSTNEYDVCSAQLWKQTENTTGHQLFPFSVILVCKYFHEVIKSCNIIQFSRFFMSYMLMLDCCFDVHCWSIRLLSFRPYLIVQNLAALKLGKGPASCLCLIWS